MTKYAYVPIAVTSQKDAACLFKAALIVACGKM